MVTFVRNQEMLLEVPPKLTRNLTRDHSEYHLATGNGVPLFLRPVKPEDSPLFVKLIKELSPTSIYYRFFMGHERAAARDAHKLYAPDFGLKVERWLYPDRLRLGNCPVGH